jgi:hypothetical protein
MILMLVISLPAFATEVKLVCTVTTQVSGKTSHEIFTFDEEKGTVGPYSIHTSSCDKSRLAETLTEEYSCKEARISDTEISYTIFMKLNGHSEGWIARPVIDRIDLKFTEFMDNTPVSSNNSEHVFSTGTCVPFKKAI